MGFQATSTAPHASFESALGGEARIARLFEMTSDLLATISLEGRFTLLNPAWESLLGWTLEELQSKPMREFMHPDDVEPTLTVMQAAG
jgi:PAS domain S-box-containing protein